MKIYKVTGEGRQSQLSFMTLLHIFMRNMFRHKSKKPWSGKISVRSKSDHCSCCYIYM